MSSVKKALLWKLIEKGGAKGLRLLIQIVLARILAPEEFGLLAILLVFVSLGDIIVLGGLGSSLLQIPTARRVDYSTAFWLSIGFSLVAFVLLSATAPLIASFYARSDLIVPLMVLALQFFPLSFNSIQVAKTMRDLNARPICIGVILAELFAGAGALVLACFGFGLWSLVFQQLAGAVGACLFTAFFVGWRPYLEFSCKSARVLLRFGYRVMLTDLLNNSSSSLYTMAIGKVFDPTRLGYYTQGQKYPLAISEVLTGALTPVLLASFSQKRHKAHDQFVAATRRTVVVTSIVLTPVAFFCAVFASDIVVFLLTEKWLPCVPVFTLYCFASLSRSLTLITRQGIMAMGNARSPFYIALLKLALSLALFCGAVLVGGDLTLVTLAWVLSCIVEQGATMASARTTFGYKLADQCLDFVPGVAVGAIGLAASVFSGCLGIPSLGAMFVFVAFSLGAAALFLKLKRICLGAR